MNRAESHTKEGNLSTPNLLTPSPPSKPDEGKIQNVNRGSQDFQGGRIRQRLNGGPHFKFKRMPRWTHEPRTKWILRDERPFWIASSCAQNYPRIVAIAPRGVRCMLSSVDRARFTSMAATGSAYRDSEVSTGYYWSKALYMLNGSFPSFDYRTCKSSLDILLYIPIKLHFHCCSVLYIVHTSVVVKHSPQYG